MAYKHEIINRAKESFTVLVDIEDRGLFEKYCFRVQKTGGLEYVQGHLRGDKIRKTVYLHRILMSPLPNEQVDHVNRNGLDNRRVNLRSCSASENLRNRIKRRSSASLFKGVDYVKRDKRWRTRVSTGAELITRYSDTEIEAAKIYNTLAAKHHKQFARLNII